MKSNRRHFLKAGASAPVLMTIRPGSTFAASLNCAQKATDAAAEGFLPPESELTGTFDSGGLSSAYVREQINLLQNGGGTGNGVKRYVQSPHTSKWYEVTGWSAGDPNPQMTASPALASPPNPLPDTVIDTVWAIAWFSVDSTTGSTSFVGYTFEDEYPGVDGAALTIGCATSVGVQLAEGGTGGLKGLLSRLA